MGTKGTSRYVTLDIRGFAVGASREAEVIWTHSGIIFVGVVKGAESSDVSSCEG